MHCECLGKFCVSLATNHSASKFYNTIYTRYCVQACSQGGFSRFRRTTLTNKSEVHYFVLKGPLITMQGPLCKQKVHYKKIKSPLSKTPTSILFKRFNIYIQLYLNLYTFPFLLEAFPSFYRLSQCEDLFFLK